MIIYTNENNPATLKLLVSAQYGKKVPTVKVVAVHDRNSGLTAPNRLPALELSKDHQQIFIPNSAIRCLFPPRNDLLWKVEEWLEWESSVLTPVVVESVALNSKSDRAKQALVGCLQTLESHLSGKFLVSSSVTGADIAVWATLYPLYKDQQLSAEHLQQFQQLRNFMQRLEASEEFRWALKTFSVGAGLGAYTSLIAGAKFLSNSVLATGKSASDAGVSAEELRGAQESWTVGRERLLTRKNRVQSSPVLPKPGESNVLITSALPYVNNVPHLGNIIGCVLSADVFARFSRLCNRNVLYICGTDEYGTATETKALEEGLTPQQICDKYFQIHNDVYRWFSIGFDHFGRTSTPEQTRTVQSMFNDLNGNGFVCTETVAQLLCLKCQRYLADRFVEGTCPTAGCGFPDARGDQCDACGRLVNAIELRDPRCKVCASRPEVRHSEQFFLDLAKLEPLLRHWLKDVADGWTNNAQMITRTWLREGLRPRCITRDLKWGVPVPLDGYRDKVFYVWFDAPIGYMSITERYTEHWLQWWRPRDGVKVDLYQFMAKDNVPFHSVMFPATLLGVNKGYTTVSHLMATEYLNYEDGKFSKSRGVGVFGTDAQQTGICSDVWRFYLLYIRPESQDSNFSWHDLATRNNSELLNNLGNFVNRALVFAEKNFDGAVPDMELQEADVGFLALCTRELKSYVGALAKAKLRDGISFILSVSRHGNQYMQSTQPWVLLKGGGDAERKRAGTIIGICCNISALISVLLSPYMPETSKNLQRQLDAPESMYVLDPDAPEITALLPAGHKLGKPVPLFTKIEAAQIEALKSKYGGAQRNDKPETAAPTPTPPPPPTVAGETVESLERAIDVQGSLVRTLKQDKADKAEVQKQVAVLLELKRKLSTATGQPTSKAAAPAPSRGKKK